MKKGLLFAAAILVAPQLHAGAPMGAMNSAQKTESPGSRMGTSGGIVVPNSMKADAKGSPRDLGAVSMGPGGGGSLGSVMGPGGGGSLGSLMGAGGGGSLGSLMGAGGGGSLGSIMGPGGGGSLGAAR
jgi:hypothetical protein